MTTPPTEQQLDEIETRAAARRTALSGWINCYSPLSEQETLEDAEVVLEEDVPALLAEVRRLRAELRIGAPWTCHVCGKENHRDVCLICETDRPDPELAASVPPGAPLRPSQPSSVSESAQSPTGAATGRLGDLPPADAEPHRLALSTALGLGTSAPWDAIRERAAELAGQGGAGGRGAVLREAATIVRSMDSDYALQEAAEHLDGLAVDADEAEDPGRLADEEQQAEDATEKTASTASVQAADGRCAACGHTVCDGDGPCGALSGGDFCVCPGSAAVPAVEAQRQLDTETPDVLTTLAPMFDGLHALLAASSRDWQTYRVDAWLWAVLCGWDCEQTEHDDTCTHGALEETAAMHGWSDETVAKARRYRAAVRAVVEVAVVSQPGKEA